MTSAHPDRERITGISEGWWTCVPECGNEPHLEGFYASDSEGRPVDPVQGAWDENTNVCAACGRIFNQDTGEIIGHRSVDLTTETSTCRHCGEHIERRGVWQHVEEDQVTLTCPSGQTRAQPINPHS